MRCHGDFLPCIPPLSSLDETCDPTSYGGKQEGEEEWCVVMLIASILTTTDLDFPLFSSPPCRIYLRCLRRLLEPMLGGTKLTNEDIRAAPDNW